jgi:hypothetical protein
VYEHLTSTTSSMRAEQLKFATTSRPKASMCQASIQSLLFLSPLLLVGYVARLPLLPLFYLARVPLLLLATSERLADSMGRHSGLIDI